LPRNRTKRPIFWWSSTNFKPTFFSLPKFSNYWGWYIQIIVGDIPCISPRISILLHPTRCTPWR